MSMLILLQAPGAGGTQGLIQMVIPFGMMFLIFWFLILRPQRKEQEKHQNFLAGLKVGDEVVTSSGILGRITGVEEKFIMLEISRGTRIQILKAQIQGPRSSALEVTVEGSAETAKLEKKKANEIEDAVIEDGEDDGDAVSVEASKSKKKKKAW